MNASSESGLCATVMVSLEVTGRFYCVAMRPTPMREIGLRDLTCAPGDATMNSTRMQGNFLYPTGRNF